METGYEISLKCGDETIYSNSYSAIVDGDITITIVLEKTVCVHDYQIDSFDEDEINHITKCSKCGETSRAPHNFSEWTSVDEGSHTRSCECGYTQVTIHNLDKYEKVDEEQHKHVCSACGYFTTEDHQVESWTNGTDGKHQGTCTLCNETIYQAHIEETIPAVPATCLLAGTTAGSKCSVCEQVLVAPQVDPIKEHNYTYTSDKADNHTVACTQGCGSTETVACEFDEETGKCTAEGCTNTNVLTIEQAIALGKSKEHNTYTTQKFYVTGVITEVYDTKFGNMLIKDESGNIFTIYGTYSADGSIRYDAMETKPVAGDTVTIYGIVGQYNDTAQIKNGGLTEHIKHTCDYSEATCTKLATCSICGATTGELAEHNYVDGKCSVCEKVDPNAGGGDQPEQESGWYLKDIAEIKATDVVVITWTTSNGATYAASNDKGTGAAPTAVVVTVDGNKLTGDIADNIKWNIANDSGNLTIYVNGSTETWLYCTNTNNGVRVGSGAAKIFVIDSASGYLKNTQTTDIRYLGVYTTNPDIRCYKDTTGNTANQTLNFYVYVAGNTGGDTCEHSWNDATCTAPKTCSLCGATEGEKLPHSYGEGVVTAPTCVDKGYTTHTCSVCSHSYTDNETEATGEHNYVDGVCSVCDAVEGGSEEPVEPLTETISFASTEHRVSQDGSSQVWKNGGVTFTNNKASSSTAVANYSNPVRLYQGSQIIVEANKITKIVIVVNSSKYVTALTGSVKTGTISTSGNTVTIEFDEPVDSFTIDSLTGQTRFNSIDVTYTPAN